MWNNKIPQSANQHVWYYKYKIPQSVHCNYTLNYKNAQSLHWIITKCHTILHSEFSLLSFSTRYNSSVPVKLKHAIFLCMIKGQYFHVDSHWTSLTKVKLNITHGQMMMVLYFLSVLDKLATNAVLHFNFYSKLGNIIVTINNSMRCLKGLTFESVDLLQCWNGKLSHSLNLTSMYISEN